MLAQHPSWWTVRNQVLATVAHCWVVHSVLM